MKKQDCTEVDLERLRSDLESPDDVVRARAVNSLCPCQVGWELFERHREIVARLMKDPCRAVRIHAQHVFDDAAKMDRLGDVEYRFQVVEEKLASKRVGRFGTEEGSEGIRRSGNYKRRRGGFVLR